VEAAVALVATLLLMVPGGLIFWAMYRSTTLTQRLHPLTPKQRKAKRRAYAILVALAGATLALDFALPRTGIVVVIAAFGGILLIDALLTPWLHYRRAKHRSRSSQGIHHG
jgi:uncharacterized membrane protein YjjB (DUF3815 family)